MSTHKTPLEDNTAVADYCLNENEVKPVVVPHQIPQNQAGGGPCSVDKEVMSLRPVAKWPEHKITEQTPDEDSSIPVPETGDSVVEVDTSLSYDDWLVNEGIIMSAGEEEHNNKIKVEDVTDSESKGVEVECKSYDDQEESSIFPDNQDEQDNQDNTCHDLKIFQGTKFFFIYINQIH